MADIPRVGEAGRAGPVSSYCWTGLVALRWPSPMILCHPCTLEVVATLPDQCLHSLLSGVGGILGACRISSLILGLHPLDASGIPSGPARNVSRECTTCPGGQTGPHGELCFRGCAPWVAAGAAWPVGGPTVSLAVSVPALLGTR